MSSMIKLLSLIPLLECFIQLSLITSAKHCLNCFIPCHKQGFRLCNASSLLVMSGQASMQTYEDGLNPTFHHSMPEIEDTVPDSHSTLQIMLLLCQVLQGSYRHYLFSFIISCALLYTSRTLTTSHIGLNPFR